MSKAASLHYDFNALNKFTRTLADKGWRVKVGIMGGNTKRRDGLSNADIGAVHEYGSVSRNIPARSFLRMPLFVKSANIINQVGKRALKWLIEGNKKQVLVDIGIACEGAIQDAFNSGGFGAWKSLKPSSVRGKIQHNPQPLVNTNQLRRSITSKVERKQ
jgi:phage gpG-like protein